MLSSMHVKSFDSKTDGMWGSWTSLFLCPHASTVWAACGGAVLRFFVVERALAFVIDLVRRNLKHPLVSRVVSAKIFI